jgi:hypothetical protein
MAVSFPGRALRNPLTWPWTSPTMAMRMGGSAAEADVLSESRRRKQAEAAGDKERNMRIDFGMIILEGS